MVFNGVSIYLTPRDTIQRLKKKEGEGAANLPLYLHSNRVETMTLSGLGRSIVSPLAEFNPFSLSTSLIFHHHQQSLTDDLTCLSGVSNSTLLLKCMPCHSPRCLLVQAAVVKRLAAQQLPPATTFQYQFHKDACSRASLLSPFLSYVRQDHFDSEDVTKYGHFSSNSCYWICCLNRKQAGAVFGSSKTRKVTRATKSRHRWWTHCWGFCSLSTSHELTRTLGSFQITVFERNSSVGGRIKSVPILQIPVNPLRPDPNTSLRKTTVL